MAAQRTKRVLNPVERRGLTILWALWLTAFLTAVTLAVLGFATFNWERSLNVSIAVLAGFIICTALLTYAWIRPYIGLDLRGAIEEQAKSTGLPSNPFADAAKVAITTQGVVLGLISFAGPDRLSPTLKSGSASLAAGVLVASLLYLQVATQPPPDPNRRLVASILFNVLLWLLGFGLVCVVAGNWST